MTVPHLVRTFHQHVGIPPHEYMVQLRLERARSMLATGAPAAEAAHHAGFADQSHLHRHFKRVIGVTPGKYRKGEAPSSRAHASP